MLKNLEHYVQVLKIEKNHSSNTIDSSLSDIKSFEKYLVKRKISFKQIVNEAEIIQKYFKYLNRSKISPTSIKRKYSSLSSYFSSLIDRKIIKKNLLNGIYTPTLSKKLPIVFLSLFLLDGILCIERSTGMNTEWQIDGGIMHLYIVMALLT